MNKLMIAATMALTLGAYVNAQCQIDEPDYYCALVYNFVVNVKTTAAKQIVNKAQCDIEGGVVCYRVKANRSFQGFIAYCDCDCGFQEEALVTLWDKKTKTYIVDAAAIPFGAFWRIGNVNLAKATDMEIEWSIDDEEFNAWGMGYGKWKNNRLNNASGNVVGLLPAPAAEIKYPKGYIYQDDECECFAGAYICEGGWDFALPENTIAFGTWNLSFNAKATAAYLATGAVPVPGQVKDGGGLLAKIRQLLGK
jgi:hypothetical protein